MLLSCRSFILQAELLGELQLSFVLFVSLASLRGFRHWQALSALLCRCGDALATDPALFTAFIRVSPGVNLLPLWPECKTFLRSIVNMKIVLYFRPG